MKKRYSTLSLILLVAIVLSVVTCPDREKHKVAIKQKVNTAVNENINSNLLENDKTSLGSLIIYLAGGPIISTLALTVFDSQLHYNNYFAFSTMSITIKGEEKIVSLGVFGHVFVGFDSDDLKKLITK